MRTARSVSEEIGPGSRIGPLAFSGDTLAIGEMIGSGATARVFACRRLRTGEELAVKVMDLSRMQCLDNAEEALKRFEVEVQAQREATHERCMGLKDIYRDNRWIFLVMERLRGGELFDLIIKRKRLSEAEARHVFRQVVEGLAFLHSRHIVHRDIKPENILVVDVKEEGPPAEGGDALINVKIADYGLSKLTSAGSVAKSMVGTPQYWAPEVLDSGGTTAYDQRADLWSLGVTLYVMLRGQYPFKGANIGELIRKGQYNLTSGAWSQASEEAKDLVQNLLRVNPADRLSLERCLLHPWMCPQPQQAPSAGPAGGPVGHPVVHGPPPQQQLAMVRWEDAAPSLSVGGDGSGEAFCLKELVQLQVSLVSSLGSASLAVRCSHAHLSMDIQKMLHQGNSLWQQAVHMVTGYATVAKQVKQTVLPDLELAVQEAEPSLAMELLDMVRGWSAQMQEDGEKTQSLCTETSKQLQDLISKVQVAHSTGVATAEAQQQPYSLSLLPPPAVSPGQCSALMPVHQGVNSTTQRLLDGLAVFATSMARENRQSAEVQSSSISEDLVDLLFLAPGVQKNGSVSSVSTGNGSCKRSCEELPVVDASKVSRGGVEAPAAATQPAVEVEAQQLQIVPRMSDGAAVQRGPLQGAGVPLQASQEPGQQALVNPLTQALRELRRVNEILLDCMRFWTNMAGTVNELSRVRDTTQHLLKYASKTVGLRKRFQLRLAEYSDFWSSLQRSCEQYCKEVEPALAEMRALIHRADVVADSIEANSRAVRTEGVVQMVD